MMTGALVYSLQFGGIDNVVVIASHTRFHDIKKLKTIFLSCKQAQGIEQFKTIRLSIFNLWEELEKVPETEFEKDLARDDSEASFVLSKNNLNAMKELKTKVNFPA